MTTLAIPHTIDAALDPAWLSAALAPTTGGVPVTDVEVVEILKTVATKVRFTVAYDGARGGRAAFCLKGLLDVDPAFARGGPTTVLECDFYETLAPTLGLRVPDLAATVVDREQMFGILIMRDVIAQGGRFGSAFETFTPDETAQSLEQLAILHSADVAFDAIPGVRRRISQLANADYVPQAQLQQLLDGPRGVSLPASTRDAARLIAAFRALAEIDERRPPVLAHGDCHIGNTFRTADGPGLIDWQVVQQAGWAQDVAYHINAVLPVELAEAHERALLDHYLDARRRLGSEVPDREEAWEQYRTGTIYGYFMWAITRMVDPEIIVLNTARLGAAVTRHDSFGLVGV